MTGADAFVCLLLLALIGCAFVIVKMADRIAALKIVTAAADDLVAGYMKRNRKLREHNVMLDLVVTKLRDKHEAATRS